MKDRLEMVFVILLLVVAAIWLVLGVLVALAHIAAKLILVAILVLGCIALAKWAHKEYRKL